jgi:ABC-type bacteriocin/lantibiotic exporter with double-glycine peptidase domain
MKLPVPHLRQEHSYTCLPACIRMILAYYGAEYGEEEIVRYFHVFPRLGTAVESVVTGLRAMGYHALWFENASLERLAELLTHNWPVIAFFRAADLPHGRGGLHSVVVVGIENGKVVCLDPALDYESQYELSFFSLLWSKLDNQGMVLWL